MTEDSRVVCLGTKVAYGWTLRSYFHPRCRRGQVFNQSPDPTHGGVTITTREQTPYFFPTECTFNHLSNLAKRRHSDQKGPVRVCNLSNAREMWRRRRRGRLRPPYSGGTVRGDTLPEGEHAGVYTSIPSLSAIKKPQRTAPVQ